MGEVSVVDARGLARGRLRLGGDLRQASSKAISLLPSFFSLAATASTTRMFCSLLLVCVR